VSRLIRVVRARVARPLPAPHRAPRPPRWFLPRRSECWPADRKLKRAFEEAMHDQAWHTAHDRQRRHQRRELRPELRHVLVGQGREGDRAAVWTLATMAYSGCARQSAATASLDAGEDLRRYAARASGAVAASRWCEIHHRMHALDEYQLTMASRMGPAARRPCADFSPHDPAPAVDPRGRQTMGVSR
jgi:hypothetical protein